jgi:aryl-alcohol dehydrogenase
MTTATAAVVEAPGAPFIVQEVTLDDPRPGEVLVRMAAVGLCATDLGVRAGGVPFPFPGVLGHEGAGVIEAVGGTDSDLKPGQTVLLSFTSCGHCVGCRDGHPAFCDTALERNLVWGHREDGTPTIHRNGNALGGHFFGQSSFATHAIVDERSVVPVADDSPLDILAPLGCSVQTGIGSVWNILTPKAGATLAVVGCGNVGLFAVMGANLLPLTRLVAVDLLDQRLEVARELGATDTVNSGKQDLGDALREITNGRGVDCVLDTTGNPHVLRSAIDALAVRGTCAVAGIPPGGAEVSVDVSGQLVGKRFVGVTEGDAEPHILLPQLVDLHRSGKLPLERVIAHYSLDQLETAATHMREGKVIKPVVRFEP